MKKTITIMVIAVVAILALSYEISKETKKRAEIERQQEESFQKAVTAMMEGNEKEAIRITEEECPQRNGAGIVGGICLAVEYYKDGKIEDAYEEIQYYGPITYAFLEEDQQEWVTDRISEIKKAKEEYDKEQKRLKEERQAQEEAEKLKKLKESGIPYVGMSEELIAKTSLGKPRDTVRHNYETKSGKVYMANLYDFPNTGYVTFTARCVNGKVTEVFDGRGQGGVNPKNLTSSGSSSSESGKYSSAEDMYEDRPDDFDSLEDAENYFDDYY